MARTQLSVGPALKRSADVRLLQLGVTECVARTALRIHQAGRGAQLMPLVVHGVVGHTCVPRLE
jgi:hypothetical protein